MSLPAVICSGRRVQGESWVDWWLFPPLTEDQAAEILEHYDIGEPYSGGPGSPFTRAAWVRNSRSYTLIKQEGGWDV